MGGHVAGDDQMLPTAAAMEPELTVQSRWIAAVVDIGVPDVRIIGQGLRALSRRIALIDKFDDVARSAIGAFDDHDLIVSKANRLDVDGGVGIGKPNPAETQGTGQDEPGCIRAKCTIEL